MTVLETSFPSLFGPGRAPQPAQPTLEQRPKNRRPSRPPRQLPMHPVLTIDGKPTLFFTIGDIAAVLNRSVGRVRALEAAGVLPPAPRRRRIAGHRGWRMYPSAYVLELAEIAEAEGVTTSKRIDDWTTFSAKAWAAHHAHTATAAPGSPPLRD